MRRRRRVAGVAAALVASLASSTAFAPSAPAEPAPFVPGDLPATRSVPVKPIPGRGPQIKELVSAPLPKATWPTGRAAVALPAEAGKKVKASGLPVSLERRRAAAGGETVDVEVLPQDVARAAGVNGLLVKVKAPRGPKTLESAALSVDYSGFKGAFGGDWASRLRLVSLQACALETPAEQDCRVQSPLKSRNDVRGRTVTATLPPSSSAQGGAELLLAVTAGASGSGGSYTATSLAPSGSWSAGGSNGGFSWSMPVTVPPSTGGVTPQISLGYSSASMDGRQVSTNSQTSWVGDGWDYSPGYIERSYQTCSEDQANGNNTTKTADLCWFSNNAVLSLNGQTNVLVKDDSSGAWKLQNNDGSRVQHKTGAANGDNDGEHWIVTSRDGTQYWFGRQRLPGWVTGKAETGSTWTVPVFGNQSGEPCYATTFAASSCSQAWRWNLDYVVDPNSNSMSLFYAQETNYYGKNLSSTGAQYVRGGHLTEIKYGQRAGAEYTNSAPARVRFFTAERCLGTTAECDPAQFTTANASRWPDTPVDQNCKSGEACTNRYAPTFWTRKRLTEIRTETLNAAAAYVAVDSWALTHTFPNQGDALNPALWLSKIVHTGHVGGTAPMPPIIFSGTQLANRVDTQADGLPAMYRYRINTIQGETGNLIGVDYSAPQCSASNKPASDSSNSMRCYPVWWTPTNATQPIKEYFHKYVVTAVREQDMTAQQPGVTTRYEYLDGAAWAYDDNPMTKLERRTWNQARGYERVRVRVGESPDPVGLTEYRYFRGMHGDKLPTGTRTETIADSDGGAQTDYEQYAGMTREVIYYDRDGGSIVSTTQSTPWRGAVVATQARSGSSTLQARAVAVSGADSKTAMPGGVWRRTSTDTTYDDDGRVTSVSEAGDTAKSGDESCTRTEYTDNDTAWIRDKAKRLYKVSVVCSATPSVPGDVVSDVRSSYDLLGYGAAPTKGNVTKVEEVTGWTGTTPVLTPKQLLEYDANGRPVKETDALTRPTTTTYTSAPAGYGLVTTVVRKNPLGHPHTTYIDTTRGLQYAELDQNGRRTDVTYDPLGRLTKVWLPGRDKATTTPNREFTYTVTATAPTAIRTRTLNDDGSYREQYDLYDGLMRLRQRQSTAQGGGRMLSDWFYNSRGSVWKSYPLYHNNSAPTGTVVTVDTDGTPLGDNKVPAISRLTTDGMGRVTTEVFESFGIEKWRTTSSYAGGAVYVDPPSGKPATAVFTDALGRTTEKREYESGAVSGAYRATTFDYNAKGLLKSVTDPGKAVWSYEYDQLGRVTKTNDPDKGLTETAYDAVGNVVQTKDAKGDIIATTYDDLDRVTTTRDDSVTGAKRTEFTYDPVIGGVALTGVLATATRFDNGQPYTQTFKGYDVAYRPTSWTHSIPSTEAGLQGDYTFAMQYTLTGQPYKATYPSRGGLPGETVTYTYDALGYSKSMYGIGGASYLNDVSYDHYGSPLRQIYGSTSGKVYVDTMYDEATRRVTQTTMDRSISPYRLEQRKFTYDNVGNPTSNSATSNGTTDTECYKYDGYARLTDVWTAAATCSGGPYVGAGGTVGGPLPYWHQYTYDARGNRKTETQHDTTGDTTKNVLRDYQYKLSDTVQPHVLDKVVQTGPGARTDMFDHDVLGNQTVRSQDGATYNQTWNREGKLTSSEKVGGATENYVYDPSGQRLIKREATKVTLYLGNHEYVLDKASNSVTGTRLLSLGGAVAARTPIGVTYVIADRQGTAAWVVDGKTLQATQRKMTVFGAERPGSTPVPVPANKGFVGGTEDATGLTHIGAREYDADTGRFISVDPLMNVSESDTLNGYSYAGNNPVTYSDPTGLSHKASEGGGGGNALRGSPLWNHPFFGPFIQAAAAAWDALHVAGIVASSGQQARYNGPSEEEVKKAKIVKSRSLIDIIKEEGGQVLMEVLGIEDMKNCFTKGDIGACVWMVVGALPIGKILKGKQIGEALWRVGKAFLKHLDDTKWAEALLARAAKAEQAAAAACSFSGETRVVLADGTTKAFKDIDVGDEVLAADPESGAKGGRKVTHVWPHEDDLMRLDTDAGAIITTDDHPYWNETDQQWQPIAEFDKGDKLLTDTGDTFAALALNPDTTYRATAYNLTVDDLHTYYVETTGGVATLVHNTNTSPGLTCSVGQGWKVGDDYSALTKAGNEPSWSTIRRRFWKNEGNETLAAQQYGEANVTRMKTGLAPQRYNPRRNMVESMELSHEPIPMRDGGSVVTPRWPEEHALIDPHRHLGGG